MRVLWTVCFLTLLGCLAPAQSQYGKLKIDVDIVITDSPYEIERYYLVTVTNELNEVVLSKEARELDGAIEMDSLRPGRYLVALKIGTDYTAQQRVWINDSKVTHVYLSWNTVESGRNIKYGDTSSVEVCPTFLYAPGNLNAPGNYPIKGVYGFGIQTNVAQWVAPHLSLLGNFNVNGYYAAFKKNWKGDSLSTNVRTRMLLVNLEMGFGLRYHVHRIANGPRGLIVDGAVKYNFPLYFNQVSVKGTKREVDWGLHQFKNFSAYGRIGFRNVGLIAEYRMSNYVISGFPELPRWTFGLQFLIPTDEK